MSFFYLKIGIFYRENGFSTANDNSFAENEKRKKSQFLRTLSTINFLPWKLYRQNPKNGEIRHDFGRTNCRASGTKNREIGSKIGQKKRDAMRNASVNCLEAFSRKNSPKSKSGSERIPEHGRKWNLKPPRSDFLANGGRLSVQSTKPSKNAKYRKIRMVWWKSVEDIQTDSERKRQESDAKHQKKDRPTIRKNRSRSPRKILLRNFLIPPLL